MAEGIVRDAHILMGAYNITGVHSQYSLNVSNDLLESTTFPLTTRERKVGLRDVEASGSGYLPFGDMLGTSGSFNTAADLADWTAVNCTVALSATSPQEGSYCCQMTATSASQKSITMTVELKADRSYRIVAYFKDGTAATGRTVRAIVTDATQTIYIAEDTTSASWDSGTSDFAVDSNGDYTVGLHWTDATDAGTIFFDSISIHEVIDKALYNNLSATETPLTVLPNGNNAGSLAYYYKISQGEYSPGGSVGELMGFSWAAGAKSELLRGTVLENDRVVSSGTSTPQQLGAVGSGQYLYAALHVLSAGGRASPSLDVIIQSDNAVGFPSAATPIITFTQATGITSEYATPVDNTTCTTDDYWRVSYTIGGTGGEFQFVVVVAIM